MNLKTFFEEKDIPYTMWEIECNGVFHCIDSDVIIESILQTHGEERKKIEGTLSVLDFRNCSIVDYLKYLAQCMIQKQSSESALSYLNKY